MRMSMSFIGKINWKKQFKNPKGREKKYFRGKHWEGKPHKDDQGIHQSPSTMRTSTFDLYSHPQLEWKRVSQPLPPVGERADLSKYRDYSRRQCLNRWFYRVHQKLLP